MSRPPAQIAADILLNPPMIIMMGGMFTMLFMVIKAATARNPYAENGVLPDGRRLIPAMATFTGIKGIRAPIAIATNSASPLLIIGEDGIEYRVIRKHRRPFTRIEMVDVRSGWKTVNLEVQFRGDVLTLAVNVGTELTARSALALFPSSVPMTAKALAIRGEVPS
jgi:hypothetical protein